MWISKFQINNFASFESSGWIALDKAINLFIGANNSGKSALLKSLNFPLIPNAHKDASTFRGIALKQPSLDFDVRISPHEVFSKFSALNSLPIFPVLDGQDHNIRRVISRLNDPETYLDLEFHRDPNTETAPRGGASIADFRSQGGQAFARVGLENGEAKYYATVAGADNLPSLISGPASENFFYFDAQRINIGRSTWESPNRLLPNAGNLPAVLAYLQGSRRPIFDLIEQLVIDILGGIARITVARRQTEDEILIWPDRSSEYEELAFSLNESGTGIGQLLAIITALVTSPQAIIVIDEINSYLHPAAVKKLFNIIRSDYNQHQYIISTHSADVISSCNAEKIYLVKRDRFESSIEEISLLETRHLKEVSSILGFSMMDVFGHERLIWVEGPTEEVCFPYLARRSGLLRDADVGFAPVFSTDAFSKGRSTARSAVDVYDNAGKRLAPLLKGMAFALDRERLSDTEVAKLERSKKKLRFLPRRCLECYLIHPRSIAKALSQLDDHAISTESVEQALSGGGEERFGAPREWNGDLANPRWLKRVDAAKLLSHVFSTLTEARVEYRKTRDGITLLKMIAEEGSDAIKELEEFVAKVLQIAYRDTAP